MVKMGSLVEAIPQVIAAILIFMGGAITARWNRTSAIEKTKVEEQSAAAEADISAGQLALQMYTEISKELSDVRRQMSTLRQGWREHRIWDRDVVLAELDRLDPGASRRLPPPPELNFE